MTARNLQFKLLKNQDEFIKSKARYCLHSGGVGSGKTYGLCLKTLKLAIEHPGIKIMLGAKTLPLLRDTTLQEWLKICPPELIDEFNKSRLEFRLTNGTILYFKTLSDPDNIKSYTLGAAGVEEMTDISYDAFKMLRTRMRQPAYPGTIYGATNPGNFGNWVYTTFIENPIPESEVVYSQSVDNSYLPDEYLKDLKTLEKTNKSYYDRMVVGKWGALEGVVYDLPFSQRIKPSELPGEYKRIFAGLDFGFNHPTGLTVYGENNENYYQFDEVYRRGLTADEIINICIEKQKAHNIEIFYCDGARPEIIEAMKRAGLNAVGAKKGQGSVFEGVMLVKGLIGEKRLFISLDCQKTLMEFDSYVWLKDDTPIKSGDDLMDSMRYALTMEITKGSFEFITIRPPQDNEFTLDFMRD